MQWFNVVINVSNFEFSRQGPVTLTWEEEGAVRQAVVRLNTHASKFEIFFLLSMAPNTFELTRCVEANIFGHRWKMLSIFAYWAVALENGRYCSVKLSRQCCCSLSLIIFA